MVDNLVLCIGGIKDGQYVSMDLLRQGDKIYFAIPQPLPSVPWSADMRETTRPDIPKETYLRHRLRGEHKDFVLLVEESITADKMLERLLDTYAVRTSDRQQGRLPAPLRNPTAAGDLETLPART